MMGDLPTDYDVIVIGTGMTGAIIAAAASRVGKSVLHLDENDYYGEEWSSFTLESFQQWISTQDTNVENDDGSEKLKESDESFVSTSRKQRCSNIEQSWSRCKQEVENEVPNEDDTCAESNLNKDIWTEEKLRSEYRKFNLDLSPRMVYSRGPMVELLISSNIAKYAEFKSVSRVLTWRNNHLEVVPCSRADVFSTRHVSVVQKRMLVKILTLISEYPSCGTEFEGFENKTLVEYLKHKKLDSQLIHYIVYAIAMADDSTPCMEGVEACQRFLQSLGRYGNTPFICPLYGAGELPQCFCRMCAVFAGIYYLKRKVDGFIVNKEGNVVAILSEGQRLNAKHFIVTSSLCPDQYGVLNDDKKIHRGIFITDKSLVESEKEQVTLLQFPPQSQSGNIVTVMEMGGACHVCPSNLFVVHMTAEAPAGSKPLENARNALLNHPDYDTDQDQEKPRILWSTTWEMSSGIVTPTSACPKNLKFFSGPDASIDYEASISEAKRIFTDIYPEEDFLPRAPDSEEILLEEPEPVPDEVNGDPDCSDNEQISENVNNISINCENGDHDNDLEKNVDESE